MMTSLSPSQRTIPVSAAKANPPSPRPKTLPDQSRDDRGQFAGLDRLAQMRLKPRLEGLAPVLIARECRQGDRRHSAHAISLAGPAPAGQAVPILLGQSCAADQDHRLGSVEPPPR